MGMPVAMYARGTYSYTEHAGPCKAHILRAQTTQSHSKQQLASTGLAEQAGVETGKTSANSTKKTCWCSAGNEGMTPIHPLWFPLRESPGSGHFSFPTYRTSKKIQQLKQDISKSRVEILSSLQPRGELVGICLLQVLGKSNPLWVQNYPLGGSSSCWFSVGINKLKETRYG